MSEAPYPRNEVISLESRVKLKSVENEEEIDWFPYNAIDKRPSKEFQSTAQEVIEARQRNRANGVPVMPLSQHLDNELKRRGITR